MDQHAEQIQKAREEAHKIQKAREEAKTTAPQQQQIEKAREEEKTTAPQQQHASASSTNAMEGISREGGGTGQVGGHQGDAEYKCPLPEEMVGTQR